MFSATGSALILFVITYALMILFSNWRCQIATGSALLYLLFGFLTPASALAAINWNVLLILIGTMGSVTLFIDSKMPNRMADLILSRCPDDMWVAVAMSLFAGLISIFVDNVATVLLVAPVALAVCDRLELSPVPMLISVSVSSNLQGASTLVGDTTSLLLSASAHMDFLDFFVMNGKPGLFFAVQLGALATIPVICFLFRGDRKRVHPVTPTEVTDLFPSLLLLATLLFLILASLFPDRPDTTNGLICMSFFLIGLLRALIRSRNTAILHEVFHELDFSTLILLAALFLIIESIREAGVIDLISTLFVRLAGDNRFLLYTLLVWFSVLISAFIDNIPYVATMLPVVSGIASLLGCDPMPLYYGLLIGSTLGGNLTPIGASANIAALGILARHGYHVRLRDFLRIGLPFTLVAVLAGYLFVWLIWG